MNDARTFGVVLPVLGVVLFASGVGAAVLGGYGAVQRDLGLCGQPIVEVASPGETEAVAGGVEFGPRLAAFEFSELSEAEQTAFEEALAAVDGEARVEGPFPHRSAFRNVSVVSYRGSEYRVSLASMNRCVSVNPLVFPAGLGGVVAGAVAWSLPALRSRRYGREDGRVGGAGPGLRVALREGNYADPTTVASFLLAVGLAAVPLGLEFYLAVPLAPLVWVGVLAGGAVVGVAASTPSRALVLGGYYAGAVLAAFGLGALWVGAPVGIGVPWAPLWATNPVLAAAIAPLAAVFARWVS